MKIFRLRSFEEFQVHKERNKPNYALIKQYESSIVIPKKKEFTVRGISYPANQLVDFKVDYLYGDGVNINWRERLICPITQLNNRLRSCVQIIDSELSPYPDSKIYITEQVTPLFAFLKQKFNNIIGSEYLGPDLQPAQIKNNIRHEDMTNLSFGNESFDYYLSFECFEHIPAYQKAITEMYRVLKPGGFFLGTFPFDQNKYNNLIRARIDDQGNIIHFTEPEYHGDPVNEQGILCYTTFGWEVLNEFRQAGFKDVYCIFLWSDVFGYLGGEQVFFIAKK
jgi:SAM-dependent methyltransferase